MINKEIDINKFVKKAINRKIVFFDDNTHNFFSNYQYAINNTKELKREYFELIFNDDNILQEYKNVNCENRAFLIGSTSGLIGEVTRILFREDWFSFVFFTEINGDEKVLGRYKPYSFSNVFIKDFVI